MKSGFVTILGRPNVGKSTLLNKFLGAKLVAVTPKPQTTRHKILGILSSADYQIIFTDTPGIFKPSYTLQKVMVKKALSTIRDTDLAVLLVEPFEFEDEIIKKINKPTLIAINKIDLLKNKEAMLPLIEAYQEFKVVKEIIPVSVLHDENLDKLKESLINLLPEGEPYYPTDSLSDRPERFFVSEMIREKIFFLYGEEIPYVSAVMIEEFKERKKGKYFIRATIYVERPSEKAIIIGKGGKAIKKLGIDARQDIEAWLQHDVYLELWVKVKEKWRRNLQDLKEFGYG
ncbi:GTPase Era [candidate division WOR-3 bacterium]|nr:GTPase Era [candidate division WOR-3 bacterium]